MRLRSGPKLRPPGSRQCARKPTRRVPRKPARAQCSAIPVLVAPFAGVVTARMADPGTLASPGVPLLQMDQAGALQLQATVDESAIGTVHKGMKVQVAIDGASYAEIAGTVAEIDPAADPASHSFLVKIDLPVQANCAQACMGRRSLATVSARRLSFRVRLSSPAARSSVRMYSTARESRSFGTSPSARHKANS